MNNGVNQKKSLKKNYIFNFINQILTLIIPLITTPYLARIFHEVGNGQIAFANNIISYFTMIANLGYSVYGQREIAKYQDNDYMRSKTFWEIVIIRMALSLISFILLLVTTLSGIYGVSYTCLIFIFSIQVIAIAFDANFYFQGQEDFKSVAIRTIILRTLCLVCIFAFVKKETDIWLYALIYSLSVLFANVIMWPNLKKSICKVRVSDFRFRKHFLPAFIIFLPTLATTIYGSLDKLMIGYLSFNPDYQNGCYNQALKLNQAILILITVIDSVMVARNSHDYAVGEIGKLKDHIYFSCNYVLHLGIPLIVGMCVLSNNLSAWFLGEGYAEVPILLNIMSVRFIVSGLACVFGNQLFIAIGKEKYTTAAHITTAFSNLILNFIFIPWLGAIGGAITTALAETVDCLVLSAIAIKGKYISGKWILAMSFKPIFASVGMFVVIYYLNNMFSYHVISFIFIAGIGGCIYAVILLLIKDSFSALCLSKFIKPSIMKIIKK